jgi:peptidoglycan/LPS O-acetylase OafA/YrhL
MRLVMNHSPNITSSQIAGASFSQGRIPELDGLRGIAILSVLLFHYISDHILWMDSASPAPGGFLFHFQKVFSLGWAGVDLFFVLSGFLIGGILLDARTSPRYFSTFYARRFFRIIPLYYLWIAVYFVLILTPLRGLLRGAPESLYRGLEKWNVAPVYFLFLQNSVKMVHGNFGTGWLGQLWSLAVEEQFYLLMPFAVRFLPQRRLVPLLWTAVVGAPVARLAVMHFAPQHPGAHYILTICRADALSMGVLLAVGWRNQEWKARFLRNKTLFLSLCSLPLLAVGFLAISDPTPYSTAMAAWGFSCIDASCAMLLAFAIMLPNGPWASFCRWPFLAEFGRISYCLYVIHEAVNLLCHEVLFRTSPRFLDWSTSGATLLAAFLAYGLAKLSWKFFEQPLLRRGHAYKFFPDPAFSSAHSERDPVLRPTA